jgi:5'-3' exonuclease
LGVAAFVSNEYEADDIIGTLTTLMRAQSRRVVVVTRDKDLAQLIRHGDEYWDYIGEKRYAYHQIAGRFGVVPERMACYLALIGDAVDNIRGVPGIGPKTASHLLQHFESVRQLYDELDRVLQMKLRNAGFVVSQLREHREAVFLARQLTAIACDMPLIADAATLQRRSPDLAALNELYDAVGFGRLLRNQAERIIERWHPRQSAQTRR